MAHFAEVKNGIVKRVIVAEKDFINKLPNSNEWIQTSYNIHGGVYYSQELKGAHPDQSLIHQEDGRKRKNYAGIGYTYDKKRDAFIPPKPFSSWKLNEESCLWEPPIPYPKEGGPYEWNEKLKKWEK